MKKISFPLVSIDDHEMINVNGEKSFFYRAKGIDTEQLNSKEINNLKEKIGRYHNLLNNKMWIRYYFLDSRIFVNSNFEIEEDFFLEVLPEKRPLESFYDLADLQDGLVLERDRINLNGRFIRILSVDNLSSVNGTDFFGDKVDHVVVVRRVDEEETKQNLSKVRQSHSSSLKKKHADHNSIGAYNEADEWLDNVTNNGEKEFSVEAYFILKGDSEKQLNLETKSLRKKLKNMGIKTKVEGLDLKTFKSGLGPTFTSLIPGAAPLHRNLRDVTLFSAHLPSIVPIFEERGDKNGVTLYTNRFKEFKFDFSNPSFRNKNLLVLGSSGNGKSVLVNTIIFSDQNEKKTIVIEKGHSYQKNCAYLGGYFGSEKFNPLCSRDPLYLKNFILSVIGRGSYSKLEEAKLFAAIRDIFEKEDINTFRSLIDGLSRLETFKDLYLYFDEYWKYFVDDSPSEFDLVYFDIGKFPSLLVKPFLVYITELALETQKKTKSLRLIIDEAFFFIRNDLDLVDEKMRQIRKEGGTVVLSTQSIDDIPYDVYNNAFIRVFYPQDNDKDKSLDEFDKENISNLRYQKSSPPNTNDFSQFYIKLQNSPFKKSLTLLLSDLELELFNTEKTAEEDPLLRYLQQKEELFHTKKQAIERYVYEKYR